ncbi:MULTISPECIES: hypothetical protein [unclassified Rhizobium]|uniref:hypothetical protein n=1 Tax=unclassified Rhizobium TaxID=2613769 RepID=UPI000EA9CBCD|nr:MULTISPECIES: hypothetical protein [unclassified Rhizobium]AYG69038.1 hypothetical protein CCGE531_23540 [Rhizobium sp. CCGE531]AYG75418.1 hypothetical protein CCGE532_23045 [Rhizobium sp. CCGE532]
MEGETQLSGRITFLIVGSLFLAITIGMGAFAVHLYQTYANPTAMAACPVFSWAFGSMVISMMLVLLASGKKTKGKIGARRGQVTVRLGSRSPGSNSHITGRGIEAEGEAGTRIISVIPSLFLIASAIGLALLGLFLFGHHRLDLIGSGMFIAVVFYIVNWSRLAWPRR